MKTLKDMFNSSGIRALVPALALFAATPAFSGSSAQVGRGIVDGGGGNMVVASEEEVRLVVSTAWSDLTAEADTFFRELQYYVKFHKLSDSEELDQFLGRMASPSFSYEVLNPEKAAEYRERFGDSEEAKRWLEMEQYTDPSTVLKASKLEAVDELLYVGNRMVDAKVLSHNFGAGVQVSLPSLLEKKISAQSLHKELTVLYVHEYVHLLGEGEPMAEAVEKLAMKFVQEKAPNARMRVLYSIAKTMMGVEASLQNVYFTLRDSESEPMANRFLGLSAGELSAAEQLMPHSDNNYSAVSFKPVHPEQAQDVREELRSIVSRLYSVNLMSGTKEQRLDRVHQLRQRVRDFNKSFQRFVAGYVHTRFFDENADGSLKRPE